MKVNYALVLTEPLNFRIDLGSKHSTPLRAITRRASSPAVQGSLAPLRP
jgi:hypothetical protein